MHLSLRALKVVPPQLPVKEVRRPRLLEVLDRAIERPVTLISAGPGSGKTVLVNQWTRARAHRVVWVSLDREDDREERFWTLVLSALHHNGLLTDSSGDSFASSSTRDPSRSMVERAVDALADAASRGDGLLVLVLDDVHVLGDRDVVGTLDALLRYLPPQLRVVMTALSDPLIPLHRYRIQGNLSEIRAAELAMSTPEVEQLLRAHDILLSGTQIATLAERTEGWVAGLRLSAMRMEDSAEPAHIVDYFATDRGSIGEYLMEEVLAALPPAARNLLIRSSICDPVSGPLADAICGSDSGVSVLRELAAKNSFVTALDHDGVRYRYHPLLREVARYLLLDEPPATQRQGHQNAARWYDAQGDLVEAFQHALTANDWVLCTDLLGRGAFEELYLRASVVPVSTIGRFVDATAIGVEANGAGIIAAQAAVSVATGRYDRAAALLEARDHRDHRDPVQLSGGAAALLAFAQLLVARQAGDRHGFEAACNALVQEDSQGPFGTFALSELGSMCLWEGSDHLADRHLKQALKQATAQSLHAIALRCVGRLAIEHCAAGRLAVAEEFLEQGAALLDEHPWIPQEFRVAHHLAAAEVAMTHGDLGLHSRFLRLVDADLAPNTDPALACMAALIHAKGLQSAGHYVDACDVLLANKRRELPSTRTLQLRADILLFEMQAQTGEPQQAIKRLEHMTNVHESTTSAALLALGRALLADGDLDAAKRVVRRITSSLPSPPLPILIDAMLLTSEVADAQGQEASAVEAATAATQLALKNRIALPFITSGPRLSGLLRRHSALRNLWPIPIEDSLGPLPPEQPVNRAHTVLRGALTGREVSILNRLTTTMTMAEIGDELYVSTNTVKTHVAAIYRKLDAGNRQQAIARGRQLHLI